MLADVDGDLERARVRNVRERGFESRIPGRHLRPGVADHLLVLARVVGARVEAALEETFEEPMIATSTVAGVCRDTRERYGGLDPGLAAVAVAGIDLGREQDGGELRIAPWLGTGAVGEVGAMPAPPPAP